MGIAAAAGRKNGSDRFWPNVTSLCWFNNNLTDQRGKTWTARNGAAFSAAQAPFGGHALSLNGSNQFVDTPNNADFDFPGQFCVDARIYMNALPVAQADIFSRPDAGGTNGLIFRITSGGQLQVVANGVGVILQTTSFPIVTGQWIHVACSRDASNAIRIFSGGAALVGTTDSRSFAVASTSTARIGSDQFNGLIDDHRVTKSAFRFDSGFSPPTSQLPNR